MLRVISGSARGHKLITLKGSNTRPTSDRVKESLFNIISGYVAGAEVLDLFAGTGSLGIEALSRGASSAVFVEKNLAAAAIVKENLAFTKLSDKSELMVTDAMEAVTRLGIAGRSFDLLLLDPPYSKNLIDEALKIAEKSGIIKEDALVAAEHDIDDVLPQEIGRLELYRSVKYGDTVLSFYKMKKLPSTVKEEE